jgi:cyanophycinase-like exopeptidase
LGVRDVRTTQILDRKSAGDLDQLTLLRDADLYYLSGGDPEHIINTLGGSPAWEIITRAHARGAALAGSSAGAIALGAYTVSWRQMQAGATAGWAISLGAVPGLVVLPHFDRMANFLFPEVAVFRELLSTLPRGLIAVGIDENTALVRIETQTAADPTAATHWRVMGQHTVTVFERDRTPRTLHVGEEVMLQRDLEPPPPDGAAL